MELRGFLLSGWARTPLALKQACRLGAVAVLALGFLPSRAAAQACPGPVSGTYTLTGNITATTGDTSPCITVAQSGTTVNLSGYTIDVSALGNGAVAIETGTTSNTTIVGNGGTIVTNYQSGNSSAIDSTGGSNITITGVKIENEPNGSPCAQLRTDTNYGNGITLQTVTGATISSNTISCYQYGVSVQNSAIPNKGTGSISGNTLTYNNYDMNSTGNTIYSAGLVLGNSSGWSVTNNSISFNGSDDVNATCVSQTPNIVTCAPALQVITNSNGNSIQNNTVNNNYGVGIYAGPTTSHNVFSGNTATNNLVDVWDDSPSHSNHWHHNTCVKTGGNLSSHAC
jgi:parallel beta-helix repeat protein